MKEVLISFVITLGGALALQSYPMEIGGFTGHTEMQSFVIGDSGNIAVACQSSDARIVEVYNQSIVLYWPTTST